jgi:hypothetical protein
MQGPQSDAVYPQFRVKGGLVGGEDASDDRPTFYQSR